MAESTCKWTYPPVRRDESNVSDYFGTSVPDPYQWLEDPDGEETQAFVKAQKSITDPFLSSCPARKQFHARLIINRLIIINNYD